MNKFLLLFTILAILTTACGNTASADDDCMTVEVARMDTKNNCYYYEETPRSFCLNTPPALGEVAPVYYYSETSDEIVWVPGAHPKEPYPALVQAGFTTCYIDSPYIPTGCHHLSSCKSLNPPS